MLVGKCFGWVLLVGPEVPGLKFISSRQGFLRVEDVLCGGKYVGRRASGRSLELKRMDSLGFGAAVRKSALILSGKLAFIVLVDI